MTVNTINPAETTGNNLNTQAELEAVSGAAFNINALKLTPDAIAVYARRGGSHGELADAELILHASYPVSRIEQDRHVDQAQTEAEINRENASPVDNTPDSGGEILEQSGEEAEARAAVSSARGGKIDQVSTRSTQSGEVTPDLRSEKDQRVALDEASPRGAEMSERQPAVLEFSKQEFFEMMDIVEDASEGLKKLASTLRRKGKSTR